MILGTMMPAPLQMQD